MKPTAMFIAGLVIMLAVGLLTWAASAMARVEEEMRSLSGFEGLQVEV